MLVEEVGYCLLFKAEDEVDLLPVEMADEVGYCLLFKAEEEEDLLPVEMVADEVVCWLLSKLVEEVEIKFLSFPYFGISRCSWTTFDND